MCLLLLKVCDSQMKNNPLVNLVTSLGMRVKLNVISQRKETDQMALSYFFFLILNLFFLSLLSLPRESPSLFSPHPFIIASSCSSIVISVIIYLLMQT